MKQFCLFVALISCLCSNLIFLFFAFTAATEILQLVGFSDDVIFDVTGKAETYLALKRNDPGLLWLVKSSLESSTT